MITDFRLKVFTVVAQKVSFTKAAVALNISQPAVTKHIRELERLTGGALFVRHGNNISITEHGRALLPYAKAVLESYHQLNETIMSDDRSFSGTLQLGASTTVAQYILPSILAGFRARYPHIEVVLTSGNSEIISAEVIDESLDFAVVEGNDINPSLHYEHFADDKIVLVTATAGREQVALKDIPTLPLVIRENGSGTLSVIDKALSDRHISRRQLNIAMQLGSSEGIVRYLLNSASYAFLSQIAASDYLRDGRLRIVEIDGLTIDRTFRFVSLHGKSSRTADIFKDFCSNHYNK